MNDNNGRALAAFQRRLVESRSESGFCELEASLAATVKRVRKKARRYGESRAVPEQLIDPFALAYAGIELAKRLKVLPNSEGEDAAISVCRHFIRSQPQPATAESVLTEVEARSDVLTVDEAVKSMGEQQLREVPAFISDVGKKGRELWVPTHHKDQVFDWPRFKKLPDFNRWYRGKGEKDRLGTKRVIGGWKDARVLRFRLP